MTTCCGLTKMPAAPLMLKAAQTAGALWDEGGARPGEGEASACRTAVGPGPFQQRAAGPHRPHLKAARMASTAANTCRGEPALGWKVAGGWGGGLGGGRARLLLDCCPWRMWSLPWLLASVCWLTKAIL